MRSKNTILVLGSHLLRRALVSKPCQFITEGDEICPGLLEIQLFPAKALTSYIVQLNSDSETRNLHALQEKNGEVLCQNEHDG
jgi:hypothetical protein